MKKITLLAITAIFAISIQSCSTEELVIEEEKTSNLPENAISADEILAANGFFGKSLNNFGTPESDCYKKGFVLYPSNWTPQVQADLCENVDTWYLPCITDIPGPSERGDRITQITETESENETDAEHPLGINYFKGWSLIYTEYTHCSDIPEATLIDIVVVDSDTDEHIGIDGGIH